VVRVLDGTLPWATARKGCTGACYCEVAWRAAVCVTEQTDGKSATENWLKKLPFSQVLIDLYSSGSEWPYPILQ
jgi:hypothetical protein